MCLFIMGWFGFGRRSDVVDLTEGLRRRQLKIKEMQEEGGEVKSPVEGGLGFLGNIASSISDSENSDSEEYVDVGAGVSEKRKRLAKRLQDMTEKMEDLSNQVYHLQQRLELIERKVGVGGY